MGLMCARYPLLWALTYRRTVVRITQMAEARGFEPRRAEHGLGLANLLLPTRTRFRIGRQFLKLFWLIKASPDVFPPSIHRELAALAGTEVMPGLRYDRISAQQALRHVDKDCHLSSELDALLGFKPRLGASRAPDLSLVERAVSCVIPILGSYKPILGTMECALGFAPRLCGLQPHALLLGYTHKMVFRMGFAPMSLA